MMHNEATLIVQTKNEEALLPEMSRKKKSLFWRSPPRDFSLHILVWITNKRNVIVLNDNHGIPMVEIINEEILIV